MSNGRFNKADGREKYRDPWLTEGFDPESGDLELEEGFEHRSRQYAGREQTASISHPGWAWKSEDEMTNGTVFETDFEFEGFDESEWEADELFGEVGRGRRVASSGQRRPVGRGRRVASSGQRRPVGRPAASRPASRPRRRPPYRPGARGPHYASYASTPIFAEPPAAPDGEPPAGPQGSELIRWAQTALNDVLKLNLPVDGFMGPAARSAVRDFQRREGLPVDGIVGPETQQALMAARKGGAESTPQQEFGGFAGEFGAFEWAPEWSGELDLERAGARPRTTFRYVKDFSGPAAECAAGLKRAGKTRAQALAIINAQIGVAITMLRKAAADLQRGKRTAATRKLFLKIFRVRPEFVPTWLKRTATIKDRGDVVATRCLRVAALLASGKIKFFCAINETNCPDCKGSKPNNYACSSWGKHRTICLGNGFWDDMRIGKSENMNSLLSTLMHEPFHIYFGKEVTYHPRSGEPSVGKFGGVNCILQFIFRTNNRQAPQRVRNACQGMAVRRELDELFETPAWTG